MGTHARALAWLSRPLPRLAAPRWLSDVPAAAAALVCGAGLAAGALLARPVAPPHARGAVDALFAVALGLLLFALYARQTPRLLHRAAGWLGVTPAQAVCVAAAPLFALLAGAVSSAHWGQSQHPVVGNLAWAAGILLVVVGGWQAPAAAGSPPTWRVVAVAAGLTALAFIVRAYDTTHLPVSLTGDEGSAGLSAINFIEGQANNLFGLGWRGFPALYFFLQSWPIRLLGNTIPALRVPSALAGALTVGGVYLLGRALYGSRVGLLSAIFLAGLHFHQHFSRIGLNNVWDGLAYTAALGALWHGWHTGRRASFLLAGVVVGLAQYFYLSSRLLVVIVPAFVAVAGGLNLGRLRQRLPGLLLLGLAALVTVLPLAWFFALHFDDFMGTVRTTSLLGPRLSEMAASQGVSPLAVLLDHAITGLRAYTFEPLRAWYRPGLAVLRPAAGLFFWLGAAGLALRGRDSRGLLLALWLLALGLQGGFSESTPAAQRYVAAAPAAALLVGVGLVEAAGRIARLWPRLAPALTAAALLAAVLMAVDDLRFYYLYYTPRSHHTASHDFEGRGAAVVYRLADYANLQRGAWEVAFFGAPYMGYQSIPSQQYLAPRMPGLDMNHPWGSPENPTPAGDRVIYVFLTGHEADLAAAQAAYPGGLHVRFEDAYGQHLFDVYQVPMPENAAALRALADEWPRSPLQRLPPSAGTWALALAALGVVTCLAATGWHRTGIRPALPDDDPPPPPAPPSPQAPPPVPEAVEAEAAGSPPVSNVQMTFNLAPGARVRVTLEDASGAAPALLAQQEVGAAVNGEVGWQAAGTLPVQVVVPAPARPMRPAPRLPAWLLPEGLAEAGRRWEAWLAARSQRLGLWAFGLSLAVYAFTRLWALDQFPIYFFGDEAVQTLRAADLVRDGFRDYQGRLLPTYFQNGNYFNLGTSVYAQVLPYLLFGKSVWVTRGTSALISLLGAAAVALALRDVYRARWWWLGVLVLGVTPAWFLHSRTAFETVIMVSAYAWALYFYLLYRTRDARWLYAALVCGALAFYSYSPGQLVVAGTALLLLAADAPYHWANRRVVLGGAALAVLLALPYARFSLQQPGQALNHLRLLDSYWLNRELTPAAKWGLFLREYGYGLSPAFWLVPDNGRDLPRHMMKGYGHLLPLLAAFLLIGLVVCARRARQAAYRVPLAALLAAPLGGAVAATSITRVLALVVPAALLTVLGLEALRARFLRPEARAAGTVLWLALAGFSVFMLSDAVRNGPTWYRDYGLGGMQWGAQQLFGEVRAFLHENPEARVRVASSWANGTDSLHRFFLEGEPRAWLESVDSLARRQQPLTDNDVFVVTPEEYARVTADPKFANVRVARTLAYPDGRAGFYFIHLEYSEQAEALFAAEAEARRQPEVEAVPIGGQLVAVTYSRLDAGRIHDMFDGETFTLGRTEEANPAIIQLDFSEPRAVTGVTVTVGTMDFALTALAYGVAEAEPSRYQQVFEGLPPDPTVSLALDGAPERVARLRLEILDLRASGPAHIHIREIELAP